MSHSDGTDHEDHDDHADRERYGGPEDVFDDTEFDHGSLEEELRLAAAILDPVPPALRQLAVEAYALHDLDAQIAELTFDSLVDALPVRGAVDVPRMLTFHGGGLTVDVEVTSDGILGQLLPPQAALVEVLDGPRAGAPLAADAMGRFTAATPVAGPFALRLRTDAETVVTEWLRA